MSNQNGVDLLLTGEETIAAIINLANKTQHEAEALVIGAPRASADEAYNTDIEITFPVEASAGDPEPDPVTGEFHYSRLDLGRLFQGRTIRIRDTATPYNNVHDLLAPMLAEARVLLEPTDILDVAIPAGPYPKAVLLKAAPLSYRFVGQFSVELQAPVADDTSFLVAPTITANTKPSAGALNLQGNLVAGLGDSVANAMFVSSNGEIEVAGGARLTQLNQGIPSAEGVYHLNVGDQGDWSIPFNFMLLDTRNGDRLTDQYNCSVKITAPGGGVLEFALTRQYGKLALIDAANQLTIDDPALYNEAQSRYQAIQRVSFYKNKLGSLDLSVSGAPLGIYEIEVKAVRKTGGAPVFVSFEVNVEGIAQ